MTRSEILTAIKAVLDFQLFDIAGKPVSVSTVLVFLVIIVLTIWFSKLLRRGLRKFFRMRGAADDGTVAVTDRLLHYSILIVGFGIGVHTLGVNLSALFAAGAVFAVAIGFAFQNIAQNFLSGLILLVERSITPGDILEVEERRVKVIKMGIRATIVRTTDDEDLIVPNAVLVSSTVKNFTFRDPLNRLRLVVGVVYGSDMERVHEVLTRAAKELAWRSQTREPQVNMLAFADSAVNFEVSVWIDDPWQFQRRMSDLHREIWRVLQRAEVVIAFPQLDLHFDPPVVAALGRGEIEHAGRDGGASANHA